MIEQLARRIFVRIVIVAIIVMLAGISTLAVRSIGLLESRIGPELRTNAEVIGDRVRSRIEAALDIGIPLDQLVGVDSYLESALFSGPGVSRLALIDSNGLVLSSVDATEATEAEDGGGGADGSPWLTDLFDRLMSASPSEPDILSLPIREGETQVATLEVHIDRLFISRQLQEISFDIVVLAGVAILLAVEVLLFIVARTLRGPLSQFERIASRLARRDYTALAVPTGSRFNAELIGSANALAHRADAAARALRDRLAEMRNALQSGSRRLAEATLIQAERSLAEVGQFAQGSLNRLAPGQFIGVRGAAFLFVLAEELTRPFMPLFVQTVTEQLDTPERAILIAIPISAFMAGSAIFGPLAAVFSDRVGRRRSFIIGALISTGGLLWTAFSGSFEELVMSRALSGMGYALTFVACQGHVIDKTDARSRTVGMSVFVGGIMAADICGPAIGGILANQVGYQTTLIVAAATATFAGLMAIILLDNDRPYGATRARGAALKVALSCLANPRFLSVLLLTAIPAKMILTGFLFFLVPLIMIDLGSTEAEIGRVAMIYGVSAIVLMTVFASVTDRFAAHGLMVGLGALLTGWALIPLAFDPNVLLVAFAVAALGVGQAMSIPAQTVLITVIGEREIEEHGPGPVLSVFRLAERLGAVIGPLVAAQAIEALGLTGAGAAFGLFAVISGTAFSALFLTIGIRPQNVNELEPGTEDT